MEIQLFAQSAPIGGGSGVSVASGVGVSGAGVEVGSPAGTVSVGTGVKVMVAVGEAVHVGSTIVGCGEGDIPGRILFAYSEINVTHKVPITPIIAAIMAGSIPLLLFVVIAFPISMFL
jgi:hypothetical protein